MENRENPRYGGTLRVGLLEEPVTVNPVKRGPRPLVEAYVFYHVYDALLTSSDIDPLAPSVATYIDVSDDNLSYTFGIRSGILWHDQNPLTSEDVKFTFDYFSQKRASRAWQNLQNVDYIECPDEETITFHLKKVYSTFLSDVAQGVIIIPKHVWEHVDDPEAFDNQPLIGSGPFVFREWMRGEKMVLESYKQYFKGRPYIDTVEYVFYNRIEEIIADMKEEKIDYIGTSIPPSHVSQLENVDFIELEKTFNLSFMFLGFNCSQKSALADSSFRKAVAHTVDRRKIINEFMHKCAYTMSSPISPILVQWRHPTLKAHPYDLGKAQKILFDAGYEDRNGDNLLEAPSSFGGEPLAFTLLIPANSPALMQVGEMIRHNLGSLGIHITVQYIPHQQLLDRIFHTEDFDMFILGWTPDGHPRFLFPFFYSQSQLNLTRFKNTEMDVTLENIRAELSFENRQKAVFKVQELCHELVPIIPLFSPYYINAYSRRFGGWKKYPASGGNLLHPAALLSIYKK